MMQADVRELIGRELTEEEQSHLNWIQGQDRHTREMYLNLLQSAVNHGKLVAQGRALVIFGGLALNAEQVKKGLAVLDGDIDALYGIHIAGKDL